MRSTILVSRENVPLQCQEIICRLNSRLTMFLEMEADSVCFNLLILCPLNIQSQNVQCKSENEQFMPQSHTADQPMAP